MTVMEAGTSLRTNGVNIQGLTKKDSLIQRIKHQQNVIKILEERFCQASNRRNSLREAIEQRSRESQQFLHTLRVRTLQNERDIRNCLILPSPSSRATDHEDSSPSLIATPPLPHPPPPPSLLNINLSVPPPALPANLVTATGLRRGQLSLKRSATGTASNGGSEASHCTGSAADLSRVRIDPCVDLLLSRFLRSLRSSEAQIAANQAELQRSKFTEDSQNGKRMMSRLRVLETENAELARQKESGRPAKIANLIGLRRRFIERVRIESARTEELIDEVESEVEVFTSTLLMLQQQLSIAHATIEVLAVALATTTPSSSPTASAPAERCVALLRAAQWPLPPSLESGEAEDAEPAASVSVSSPSSSYPATPAPSAPISATSAPNVLT